MAAFWSWCWLHADVLLVSVLVVWVVRGVHNAPRWNDEAALWRPDEEGR